MTSAGTTPPTRKRSPPRCHMRKLGSAGQNARGTRYGLRRRGQGDVIRGVPVGDWSATGNQPSGTPQASGPEDRPGQRRHEPRCRLIAYGPVSRHSRPSLPRLSYEVNVNVMRCSTSTRTGVPSTRPGRNRAWRIARTAADSNRAFDDPTTSMLPGSTVPSASTM